MVIRPQDKEIRPDGNLHCDSLRTGRTLNLSDRSYFQAVVASTFALLLPIGSITDFRTEGMAAWCNTKSTLEQACSAAARSSRSA